VKDQIHEETYAAHYTSNSDTSAKDYRAIQNNQVHVSGRIGQDGYHLLREWQDVIGEDLSFRRLVRCDTDPILVFIENGVVIS
jgi:hypothetical protein